MSEYSRALSLLEENFDQDLFANQAAKQELRRSEENLDFFFFTRFVAFYGLFMLVFCLMPFLGIQTIASVKDFFLLFLVVPLVSFPSVMFAVDIMHIFGYFVPIKSVPGSQDKEIVYFDYVATPKLKNLLYKRAKAYRQEKLAYITTRTENGYTSMWLMTKFNQKIVDSLKVKTVDLADTYAQVQAWKEAIKHFEETHLPEFNQKVVENFEFEKQKVYQQVLDNKNDKKALKQKTKNAKAAAKREQKELLEFNKRLNM